MRPSDAAREAFAIGWATTTAQHPVPLTTRARIACEAAARLAEASPQPGNQATLQLGQLEGIWAVIYARREALEKLHADALANVLDLIKAADWDSIFTAIGQELALDPNLTGKALAQAIAGKVEALIGDTITPVERAQWREAMNLALIDAQAEGQAAALSLVGDAANIRIDFNIAADAARAALDGNQVTWDSSSGWIEKQVHGIGYQISQALSTAWGDGASAADMEQQIMDLLGVDRSIAGTILDQAIGQSLSVGALDTYSQAGVQYADFVSAGDGRVCFPAGTKVATPDGDRSIESLHVGDVVITPSGSQRVTAAMSRPYDSTLVYVEAEGRSVIATSDHPFSTNDGWVSAGNLSLSHRLDSLADKVVDIDRVVHFRLTDANDMPAKVRESGIPSSILRLGSMPVVTIDLKRHHAVTDGEVDAPSTDGELLDELDAEVFEGFTDAGFESVLASIPAVATDVAEKSSLARTLSSDDAALLAGEIDSRATALLGAEVPVETLLGSESDSAPLAIDVFGLRGFTGLRTDRVPVSYASLDDEVLPADVAVLRDAVRAASFVALARAEGPLLATSRSRIEYLAASTALAGYVDGSVGPIAERRTESSGSTLVEELSAVLTRDIRHDSILVDVYDITVESEHVFYANGFLVHNCAVCSDAEDNSPYLLSDCPQPPRHVRCRCTTSPSDYVPNSATILYLSNYTGLDSAA